MIPHDKIKVFFFKNKFFANFQENFRHPSKSNEIKLESEIGKIKTESQQSSNQPQNSLPDAVEIRWCKCPKCPFLSQNLDSHTCSEQQLNRSSLNCPGCDNVFYVENALKVHLLEDHLTPTGEVEEYLTQIHESNSRGNKENTQCNEKSKGKSRIYIKNVQLLKKPQNQDQPSAGKSKIYIKDVQLLRKPSQPPPSTDNILDYLEDFNNVPMGESELQDFGDFQTHSNQPQIFVRNVETLNNVQQDNNVQDNNYNNFDFFEDPTNFQLDTNNFTGNSSFENERNRSKIFIKNISVLKEPNQSQHNLLNAENSQNFPTIHLRSVDELNSTIDNQPLTSNNADFLDLSADIDENEMDFGFQVSNSQNQNQMNLINDFQMKNNSHAEPFLDMYLNLPTPSNQEKYSDLSDNDFLMFQPPIAETFGNEEIEEIPDDPGSEVGNVEEAESNDVVNVENLTSSPEIPTISIQDNDLPESVEKPTSSQQPRIYVASNLMKESSSKKSKGRPKGAKTIVYNTNSGSIEREYRCGELYINCISNTYLFLFTKLNFTDFQA